MKTKKMLYNIKQDIEIKKYLVKLMKISKDFQKNMTNMLKRLVQRLN